MRLEAELSEAETDFGAWSRRAVEALLCLCGGLIDSRLVAGGGVAGDSKQNTLHKTAMLTVGKDK